MKHVSVRPRFANLVLFFVLVLSFWCVSVVSAQWNQLGADIDWHHEYSLSGYAVSLSLDGNRVAIGARRSSQGENGFLFHAGQVQVFDYDGAGWTKVGLGIDGEAIRDYLGWSVSLTPDGNRVAVGAPNNDGGGIDAGYVQIFDYVGGNWTQVGNDIEGEAAGDLS
ncbi:MAG: FG-GAP repeat protein, partial [Saprospiraceae bacterium]|nr:FG-GAP repeat protein [Saprospiraceae bacterium]